ncbi:MAG TPA: rhodanese-like domain-containing protein [Methylomirabilota bacterium]|jgi:cytochrome c-type biogenesis protein|nr:rhodanese-like domain-containing protein [Methylomirabilota bacterium]
MSVGKAPGRALLAIASFGIGLALTLTAYGAALSYVGKIAGFGKLNLTMVLIGGTIAFVFGLWLMKVLTFTLPSTGVPAFVQKSSPWSVPFLTGVCLGNWGIGCPDPVFYVLMVYLATSGDVAHGVLVSAVYAAGRSLPIVALAVLGLLGVNTLPALLRRRDTIERVFGWTLAAFGAWVVSRYFSGWYLGTWVHEAWNWTLYNLNANFGEIRASDHPHVHGGPIGGFVLFIVLGFLIPGLALYVRKLAGGRAPLTGAAIAAALALFFYLPPALAPDLTERFAAGLRPAPVWAPDALLPKRPPAVASAHAGHEHGGSRGPTAPDDVLVSTAALEGILRDPAVRVLDVRAAGHYRARHIPNAISLPYALVQDGESRIRGKRLPDADLAERFGRAGIGAGHRVVVYDDFDGAQAARIAWMLLYLGHGHVSVLDGGFPRWLAERRPTDERVLVTAAVTFPVDVKPHLEATASFIVERLAAPGAVVVDVRAPAAYAVARAPKALNIPWRQNLTGGPAPVWKPAADLRVLYEAAGVTRDKTIVVQGDAADLGHLTVLTLRALGYAHVRSYDRSWSEWGPDLNLPKIDGQGQMLLVARSAP